jgi:predicted nucleic-acid-binding protein
MTGLDANILVRYFTQDDPVQAALATEVIEQRLSEDEPGFISIVSMAETVWVLDRHYRFDRERIAAAIEFALRTDVLVVESEPEVFTAMVALRERRGEFADALIAALCAKAGCSRILSFDAGARRLPGYEHP